MSIEKAKMTATSISNKNSRPQRWQLEVKFWPVVTVDGQVQNINQNKQHMDFFTNTAIRHNVAYDNQIIACDRLIDPVTIRQNLLDDKETHAHQLMVWIANKFPVHNQFIQGHEVSVCAACEILIEGLVISNLITGGGMILLGENDRKVSLEIQTPIYRWLLSRKNEFFKPYPLDPIQQAIQVKM
jgi:hypothetical protein